MNLSLNWRGQKARYGLVGETCQNCGEPIFPPRDICPHCNEEAEPKKLAPEGQVFVKRERE